MTFRAAALLRLAAAAAVALSLSGCISLLPKSKPSQLYKFGTTAAATAPAPAPAGSRIGVLRAGGIFQREAASDRILTVTGERAAYIADARWVAPAEVLFDEAVATAFEGAGRVRLVGRGEPALADYALRLDVRTFETRYHGESPTVLVRVHAVLLHFQNRTQAAEQTFEAQVPAAENRVSAIVAAYDEATGQVLKALVGWADGAAT
jgi:cholesterol transport system auxiliary component